MKRAADAGFERALYTYAMTCKIFWDDEEYFSRLTRENVDMIGRVVRSLNRGRDQKKNGYVRVVPHSEKKGNDKVQFSSPETGDGNVKKRTETPEEQ
ncbi:hypothetical protein Bca101_090784 [Brassica carinata]